MERARKCMPLLALLLYSSAFAQKDNADPILSIPSPISAERAQSLRSAESSVLRAVSRPDNANRFSSLAQARYAGTLQLNPALLAKPTDEPVDLTQPAVGFGLPRQLALVKLEIDGTTYELFYDSEAEDPKYGYHHVTMNVVNMPGAYAHFSLEPKRGLVLGTLYAPPRVYRIVPNPDKAEQDVFELRTESGATTAPQIKIAGDAGLAARHEEIEAIAKIRPSFVTSVKDRPISSIRGGALGTMRNASAAEFSRVARDLAFVTRISGQEKFQADSERRLSDGGKVLSFRQVIGGIPVNAQNEVFVDSQGRVESLIIQAVAPGIERSRAKLSKPDALRRVSAELGPTRGEKIAEVELLTPIELVYLLEPGGQRLRLVYRFDVRANNNTGADYRATVSALDGTTELVELTKRTDYT